MPLILDIRSAIKTGDPHDLIAPILVIYKGDKYRARVTDWNTEITQARTKDVFAWAWVPMIHELVPERISDEDDRRFNSAD